MELVKLLMGLVIMVNINSEQATEYMEDYCGGDLYITDGIRLESQAYSTYGNDIDCIVILRTTNVDQRFIFQFDYVDLEDYFGSCTDFIELLDGAFTYSPVLKMACVDSDVEGFFWTSTSNSVLMRWFTDESYANTGFSMTITVFHWVTEDSPCNTTGLLNCGNDGCISDALYCNGINDCANNVDEIRNDGSVCSVVGPGTNKPQHGEGIILASATPTIMMSLMIGIVLDATG